MHPLERQIASLAQRFGLSALYAFGSRAGELARGAASPGSEADADIGVQPLPGHALSARDRVRLAAELEDLFRVPRVDLVVLPEAPPFLALDVIRGELLYCRDPDSQAEDELHVLRRAGDLAPFERERRQHILGGAT